MNVTINPQMKDSKMSSIRYSRAKTALTCKDLDNYVFQKFWVVGEDDPNCSNFIGETDDPANHNECCTDRLMSAPKYFTSFAEARKCAAFWNERVPWEYNPAERVPRHGMNCAFKPRLVKVVFA